MALPIQIPFAPMEALLVATIPSGPHWQFEPKWDGFRCLAFRDGSRIELQSKSGQPLARYFPEVISALEKLKGPQFVLDGELVIPVGEELSFDELLLRIHPAKSRVEKLAREHPALLIVFDLLVDKAGKSLVALTLRERRAKLERFAEQQLRATDAVRLSPATLDRSQAEEWLSATGAGLDGIVAKRLDLPYQSGERTGMQKIKRIRSADCVIGGFRYSEMKKEVGSLLLGLYDANGLLHHVGFSSSLKSAERPALTRKLEKLIEPPGFTGRAPGGPSRWSTKRSTEWQPLKPQLVAEVAYDHFTQGRFRHGTKFLRWRPDKAPQQCTMKQVRQESTAGLELLSNRKK
ncbi:MAG: ATP-dependent DNA ligase [Verrucomicrobiota bacterium]